MVAYYFDYATPSAFESTEARDRLGLAANRRRRVRFSATVKAPYRLHFRNLLRALGELVWSDDTWLSNEGYLILDPIVTVHSDRVFFEAFSQDQSVYGAAIVDRDVFEPEGEVVHGTTNIDFTAWLWAALQEMRSSRETMLRVDTDGVAVETVGAGGRYEGKVDISDDWVRGFLQVQSAMMMPGTRLNVRPVDLLAAIRFLRFTKAKISPRALRYEMQPGEPARLVLEPFEKVIELKGCEHGYTEPRTIRTWGRRRLRLLEPLLPFASHVDVYLKGRALPSFYAAKLPKMTFVLGLSGWTANRFTADNAYLLPSADVDPAPVLEALMKAERATVRELVDRTGLDQPTVAKALERLGRGGRCLYDVETREVRHRELFESPVDEARLYPPDPRREMADHFVADSVVELQSVGIRETRKKKKLKTPDGKTERELVFRDFELNGRVETHDVHAVLNESQRVIFGKCGCAWFEEHLLNRGPCAHMLALAQVAQPQLVDGAASTEAPEDEEPETEDK